MRRLFGAAKPVAPPPSLSETSDNMTSRADKIDEQVKKLEGQLAGLRDQMKKTRPGPGLEAIKRRALALLKQKKLYEGQLNTLMAQQYNVDQTRFNIESMQNTVGVVQSMKAAAKEMGHQMKHTKELNINYIDNLQDELQEYGDMSSEINEMLSYNYGVPDGLDDDELLAELDGLESDMMAEGPVQDGMPSYLQEPDLPDLPPVQQHAAQGQQHAAGEDEWTTPVAQKN